MIVFNFENMEKILNEKIIAEIETALLAQKKQVLHELDEISRKDNHEADNKDSCSEEW